MSTQIIQEIKNCSLGGLDIKVKEIIYNNKRKKIDYYKKIYNKLYPKFTEEEIKNPLGDIIETKKNDIIYIEFKLDENGNKIYLDKEITIQEKDKKVTYKVLNTENLTDSLNNELNPEVKILLENGTIKEKESLDSFIQRKIKEDNLDKVLDSDYNLTLEEIPENDSEEEKELIKNNNEFKKRLKESILYKIQESADFAFKKAQDYLAQMNNLTEDQIKRYKIKLKIAEDTKSSDTTIADNAKASLSLEAELSGKTVDELADLIIKLGTEWNAALDSFSVKIEAVRVAVKSLLEKDPKKAVELITIGSKLNASVTDDEIKKLFLSN